MKLDFTEGRLAFNPEMINIVSDIDVCIEPSPKKYSYFEIDVNEDLEYEKFEINDTTEELQVEIKLKEECISEFNTTSITFYVVEEELFELFVHTITSSIDIDVYSIKLEASTVSGIINVMDGVCMRINSESGFIYVDTEACEDTEIIVRSKKAKVCVNVLDVDSYCGKVESEIGVIYDEFGDGGEYSPYLDIKTISGNIELTSVEEFDDEEDE